jgi:UDP-glucose 4-epimerase
MPRSVFLAGGAGFIGSHVTDRLLAGDDVARVTIYDNFSSGREWHYERHRDDPRLSVVRAGIEDAAALTAAIEGHDLVVHLASNPDIARAATEPAVDFHQGTVLTHNVLEAMRVAGPRRILYASGSGVYGDLGAVDVDEDHGPLVPISTYGASKLAGEALICSYCFMFDFSACAFRFGNVVGPRQTHGVGFDFIRRLLEDPSRLRILGDGSQSKPYVHVDDIVDAMLIADGTTSVRYAVYNVATEDVVSVREIADLAAECLGLDPASVTHEFTGGDRGWRGDVPVVRLDSSRIRALGWVCSRSGRAALRASMEAILADARAGRL